MQDPTNFANGPDNEIYCVYCYEHVHGKKAKTKSTPLDTTSIAGDGDLGSCPRWDYLNILFKTTWSKCQPRLEWDIV